MTLLELEDSLLPFSAPLQARTQRPQTFSKTQSRLGSASFLPMALAISLTISASSNEGKEEESGDLHHPGRLVNARTIDLF